MSSRTSDAVRSMSATRGSTVEALVDDTQLDEPVGVVDDAGRDEAQAEARILVSVGTPRLLLPDVARAGLVAHRAPRGMVGRVGVDLVGVVALSR